MLGETGFTALIALFWLSEFVFASVVVYWFVTQGFASSDPTVEADVLPLENRDSVRTSLLMWGGFFAAILLLIVLGA